MVSWSPGSIMLNTQSNMLKGIIAISGIVAASVVVVVVVKALAKKKQAEQQFTAPKDTSHLSSKLHPAVRKLISAKRKGDTRAIDLADKQVYNILKKEGIHAKKVIPRGFTEQEMANSKLLSKRISAIAQMREKNPDNKFAYAIARSKILKAPACDCDDDQYQPIPLGME